jgi:hypothetical protein
VANESGGTLCRYWIWRQGVGVVEDVGKIAELIKKIGDIDLYKKILALETEVMELTRDKRRADDRIEELE